MCYLHTKFKLTVYKSVRVLAAKAMTPVKSVLLWILVALDET